MQSHMLCGRICGLVGLALWLLPCAAAQVDLRWPSAYYPNIKGLGVKEAQVARIYELQK